jgi:hypothetical protein
MAGVLLRAYILDDCARRYLRHNVAPPRQQQELAHPAHRGLGHQQGAGADFGAGRLTSPDAAHVLELSGIEFGAKAESGRLDDVLAKNAKRM